MNTQLITIETLVNSDINKTWNCYTAPEHITKWNFAADTWHCPSASNDLRVGGKYTARMEAKDGSFGFDFEFIYDDINAPNSMAYKLLDKRKVKVNFETIEGATKVVVVFEPETENPVELQREGWQAILNNFKKYVEVI
jgi:uncharacterized protein YndB with AHSA1/START domain